MDLLISKAIQFATLCHANQTRKGTDIPYILHCLEAGTIAASLTNDGKDVNHEVVAATILHDTIEDAAVSYDTLRNMFNDHVANLIRHQSEDKSQNWLARKQATIDFLQVNTCKKLEIATLADKLSNMRAIAKDYERLKEQLWTKFNAGKAQQQWYYESIAKSLRQVRDTDEYQEYIQLIQEVFNVQNVKA